jgi:hypothetical protein
LTIKSNKATEARKANSRFDFCDRCGNEAELVPRLMFSSLPIIPVREYYCEKCIGRMRIYGWIGFSLLFLSVAGLVIAYLAIISSVP